VFLEVICFRFLVGSNSSWGVRYFNTSNWYVGSVLGFANSVKEYAGLREVNRQLAQENVRLNEELTRLIQTDPPKSPAGYLPDSTFASRYQYSLAKVVDVQTKLANNYLTIDKGSLDGIAPGMGVISATGVVGKVQYCSPRMSVVTSILHSRFMVSTELPKAGEIGTVVWGGRNGDEVRLLDISRFKKVEIGDTAYTSGYNPVFPPGVMIGVVKEIESPESEATYSITLQLATDFHTLGYVYVIKNHLLQDMESLIENSEK
jgi:rod shape-determining protein MreC